jgi:hypothetical protein
MAGNTRSYVKFIRAQRGNPSGIGTAVEVKDRDLAKLDIPASADYFYFYEASINPKDGHMNQSPVYIVAQKMLTREEAKLLLVPDPAQHTRIGWDQRLAQNEVFALTRGGDIEPVGPSSIVIDAKKNQLYPEPAVKPAPAVKTEFSMKTRRPIPAPLPATFRPRRPKP